jgi:hypothetical protein
MQVRQGMFHERLFLALAPQGRGIPGAIFDGPPRAEPRHVPSDPRFAARVALALGDPSRAWDALPRSLLTDGTTDSGGAPGEMIAGIEEFLNIDLGRELFGAVGRQLRFGWGHASPLPRQAAGPLWRDPWALSVGLRNPDAARLVLRRADGLARALGSHRIGAGSSAGVVWYDIPSLAPLAPAYRLQGRFLHIASSPAWLPGAGEAPQEGPAGLAPQAARLLPPKAHVQFHLSSQFLADAIPVRRSGRPWGDSWRAALRQIAGGNAPPAAGAGQMDSSGLLLQWVSPVSAPVLAWLALDGEEDPDGADQATAVAPEDPLY